MMWLIKFCSRVSKRLKRQQTSKQRKNKTLAIVDAAVEGLLSELHKFRDD